MEELESRIDDALGQNVSNATCVNPQTLASTGERQKAYQQGEYEQAHFVIHPGYGPSKFGAWEAKDYDEKQLLQDYWQDYIHSLGDILDEALRQDNKIHVIHDKGRKNYNQKLLDAVTEEELDGEYTRSIDGSGRLKEGNLGEVVRTLNNLEENGSAVVHGEIYGRCPDYFIDQIENQTTIRNVRDDLETLPGEQFPPFNIG